MYFNWTISRKTAAILADSRFQISFQEWDLYNLINIHSGMFPRISTRPSSLDFPATRPAWSGCPTCRYGSGLTSRWSGRDNQRQAHYLSVSTIQVIATCICLSLSAYVTLALHFAPKLYIIIFQPHKNDRSFFTTASKDVRCHIGRGQSTGPRKSPVNGSERMKGLSASAMLSSVK